MLYLSFSHIVLCPLSERVTFVGPQRHKFRSTKGALNKGKIGFRRMRKFRNRHAFKFGDSLQQRSKQNDRRLRIKQHSTSKPETPVKVSRTTLSLLRYASIDSSHGRFENVVVDSLKPCSSCRASAWSGIPCIVYRRLVLQEFLKEQT